MKIMPRPKRLILCSSTSCVMLLSAGLPLGSSWLRVISQIAHCGSLRLKTMPFCRANGAEEISPGRRPGNFASGSGVRPKGRMIPAVLQSLRENSRLAPFCSARLQAGTLESRRCPPEGGRYMNQYRVLTQTLQGAQWLMVSETQGVALG